MSIKIALALAVIGVAGGTVESASAATLFLSGVSPNASMTVTFPGLSAETTPYVGQINWSFDRTNADNAGLDALVAGTTLSTFCIEGTQNVYLSQNATFSKIYSDISQAPQDNVGSHLLSYQYPFTLDQGSYFWTIAVVDEYGNSARSKEASFVVN